MNPAPGSEVHELARLAAERIIARLDGRRSGDETIPRVLGDVRTAFVASLCAQLCAAEAISGKRLRDAGAPS